MNRDYSTDQFQAFSAGGPFLRFPQKWGFFRALQLQTEKLTP